MAKYHITESGNPAPCTATKRPCPRGGADEHYESKESAAVAYEKKMAAETSRSYVHNEGRALALVADFEKDGYLSNENMAELESYGWRIGDDGEPYRETRTR